MIEFKIILILYWVFLVVCFVNANSFVEPTNEDFLKVNNPKDFTGKVVVVTGSSSGKGRATVKLFSALGANVVVTSNNEAQIKSVAQEVQQLSPQKLKPLEVFADVTKSEDLNKLIAQTISTFGKIDILVNNVGVAMKTLIQDKDFMQKYDLIMNINLRSVAELNYLAVPHLLKTNGTIIQISSVGAIAPVDIYSVYDMSKIAIHMMTKCLALELGPLGIRINSISPGFIASPMSAQNEYLKAMANMAIEQSPLRRLGQTLDIAKGIVFLASNDATFITGANLIIDGGLSHNFLKSYLG